MATKRKGKGGAGAGGLKNGFFTVVTFLVLAGAILSWAQVNNINSVQSAYDYFKSWSDEADNKIKVCRVADLEWECRSGESPSSPGAPPNDAVKVDPSKPSNGNDALGNKSNTELLAVLEKVKIAEPQDVSYNRADWKHWRDADGNGCDTRQDVLIRDGSNVKKDDKTCKVLSGKWISPYDLKEFTEPGGLDIDHIVPLSWAAKNGGAKWDANKKEKFANDMNQLLAVSAAENRKKGDKGPGEYLPPNKDFQCTYVKTFLATVVSYDLTLPEKDSKAIRNTIQSRCS